MVKVRYPVWKYYSIVTEDNREKAKCVFCNKIFSNIPERMEKHLIYVGFYIVFLKKNNY
jgi:hypothetical protein